MKKIHQNPVYERERIRIDRSFLVFPGIPLYAGLISAAALAVFFMMIRQANAAGQSSYEGMMQMYLVLTMAESILLMLVIPGLVGTALARDRERGALPVLQSSGISAVGMVSGKFLSCLGTALLYLVCGIPAVFLVYIYGGIPLSAFFGSLGVLILTAMFLVSVCLMISSLCPRAGTGAAVSYLVTAFLTVGTLLIHYLPVILFGASYGTSPGMKVPWYEYILLCNPVLTLYGILSEQTGNPDALFNLINVQGNYRKNHLTDRWSALSLAVLAVLLLCCLIAAVRTVYRREKPVPASRRF